MLNELLENNNIKIEKITVSTHRKGWVIYITADKNSIQGLENLKKQILNRVPELKELDFCILNYGTSLQLQEIININLSFIKKSLATEFPGLQGSLKDWKVTVDNDNISIHINNPLQFYYIQLKNINKWLEKFIWDNWKLNAKIFFMLDESSIKKIRDKEGEKKYTLEVLKNLPTVTKEKAREEQQVNTVLRGKVIKKEPTPIINIIEEDKNIAISGEILSYEEKVLRTGRTLITFDITDYTDSITCKFFLDEGEEFTSLKKGSFITVYGNIQYDKFTQELTMLPRDINIYQPFKRTDNSENKRIELHAHTKMSAMDATCSAKDLIKRAKEWGHEAIAITDHGVVQAFPEAYDAGEQYGVKVIYGVEAYLVDDADNKIVINPQDILLDEGTYVVFDFETTGLDNKIEEIIEIGAVKVKNGEIIGQFSSLIKPKKEIPEKITQITGIRNSDVQQAPNIEEILPQFMEFCNDAILVAHNANFDYGFLTTWSNKLNLKGKFTVIDTLSLSRAILPNLKNHKLKTLTEYYNVPLENHHRAVDDCTATAQIFLKLLLECKKLGCSTVQSLTKIPVEGQIKNQESYHCIILAKNQTGLKNLYKLISLSHIKYFYRQPKIPKSIVQNFREGLIIGSACEAGEIFQMFLQNKPLNEIEERAKFYDYLEIQPCDNNEFLLRSGVLHDKRDLIEINKQIIAIGEKLQKYVVATGDVHFLEKHDGIFREILMASKGFTDAEHQPPLYYKTTEEMLKDFEYLPKGQRLDVVINNPKKIADQVEKIKPIPDELYTPKIENADEMIKKMCKERSESLYGNPLPKTVQDRLDKELNSIITNGFGVIYYISHKLVTKSLADGYLVGSRGSVGSSLVATFCDITEVNPLPPHYLCSNCKYSEFIEDGSVASGVDLPDKNCPKCGEKLKKDGHDIPFETFLGFNGDKVPDIDLNFSGDYQPKAHKYTEELFGKDYVFRAGTIGTIAEKTAYGFVQKYFSERNMRKRTAEINRMVMGCTGIKRTTGQHPGGLMVVPDYKEVYDFCPIQYPADDRESGTITTHFDYNAISSRLLKLDILGHDDPTVIRMLEDLTGVNSRTIPLDDKETMSIFSSTKAIGLTEEQLGSKVATLGIPEFGTKFVRQMLEDTKPTTFSELVRISGLSHGTDVWLNNAQELVKNNIATLSEVISTRDDIMVYLIYKGLEPSQAFKIMENVRKGKGLTPEHIEIMKKNNVPDWYIESCQKIKYMFPKAHAVAYVTMAFRIAYFKVKYPLAFYAAYFSVRADDFNIDMVCKGEKGVREQIRNLNEKGNNLTQKEKNALNILEIIFEMLLRGFVFHNVDLYTSHHTNFLIKDNGLIPPFTAIAGLGKNAAKSIVEARENGEFLSIEDLRLRTGVSKTVLEAMAKLGCLDGLPETNQLSLF
ncbi:PolC-type DNA polymerase III [Anaerobranca gottschalkii]|uniref:DNA polymerase III PolC-type n=1 Tax=Anaerobranca gottschalkii DSM 13577 TaxID=1120990 RepID=A0A1H9ZBK2_9FIRM|nr:PolC-type DNA polymerase III [Anaerobranca gottschalkii]SES78225.1 DNA polymerase-3 subunit alpha [Anaerobranca gottschalkii DSM 13577]